MEAKVRLSVTAIPLGAACGSDVLDDQGRTLVGRGVTLTQAILDGLTSRGVSDVYVSESAAEDLRAAKVKLQLKHDQTTGTSFTARRVDRSREPYSAERSDRFSNVIHKSLETLDQLGAELEELSSHSLAELARVPAALAEMLVEDGDQSISVSTRTANASLANRCARLSLLAMGIGLEMELPDEDIALLGGAGLLHDLGLLLLPERMRNASEPLSLDDADRYRLHPEVTVDLLSKYPDISDEMQVLIMQVHELPDGSGFPRGIKSNRFHRLTRVLNLAEIYIALTGAGPGRLPLVPYDATAFMLFQCRNGTMDPEVMRALVSFLSLYGIDTQVALSDGSQATVLRRDGDSYDLPVVQIAGQEAAEEPRMLRLSESDLKVTAAIARPHQMRLDSSLVASLTMPELLPL